MGKSIGKGTVIGVLALFLLVMVGYALFSETITVSGTATAKGKFEITPTCIIETPTFVKEDSKYIAEGGYENPTCSLGDNNIVNMSIELKYPGAEKFFTVKYTNTGDIAAKLPLSDHVNGFTPLTTIKRFNMANDELISTSENAASGDFWGAAEMVFFEDSSGNIILGDDPKSQEFALETNGEVSHIVLQPGTSIYIPVSASWESTYQEKGVYYVATAQIPYNWQQHN